MHDLYRIRDDDWSTTFGVPAPSAPAAPPAVTPVRSRRKARLTRRLRDCVAAPDLARDIGSPRWFGELGAFAFLTGVALTLWPSFDALQAASPVAADQEIRDEYRRNAIMPLALGAESGRRMGPGMAVTPLADAPERPRIVLAATIGHGDSLGTVLNRTGLSAADTDRVLQLVTGSASAGAIAPGTRLDITLGRRGAPGEARPLESLSFRARFDLRLEIERSGGGLAVTRIPIRVDDTPLRIRGTIDGGLYRSARAAGAPAGAVQQYLQTLNDQLDVEGDLRAGDTFDIIVSQRRAETGERLPGRLLYAGVERGDRPIAQLMRWGADGRFYEASGVGEQRSGLMAPVPGSVSSRFGMRRHPILGFMRMHSGMDFRASYGTPILAVTDALVASAGRAGGCGNAVRLDHGGGIATRYCHMSRMAVAPGQQVRRGQVIGWVGSTGLSTGPHLHYEMYRNGRSVDPASVRFVTRAALSREELRRFHTTLATLKDLRVGAALAPLPSAPRAPNAPAREIDRLARR